MSGLAYLMGELASNKPDPNAEIKKEIAAYARNPKTLAQLMDEVGKKINRY